MVNIPKVVSLKIIDTAQAVGYILYIQYNMHIVKLAGHNVRALRIWKGYTFHDNITILLITYIKKIKYICEWL
jgi:hypothetical protein